MIAKTPHPGDAPTADDIAKQPVTKRRKSMTRRVLSNWSVRIGGAVFALLILMALFAPILGSIDPLSIDPGSANMLPLSSGEFMTLDGNSFQHFFLMGADNLGRDLWSRTLFGARASLTVGISVAIIAVTLGMFIGLVSGYFRKVDSVVMRVMDGLMAIPAILFAICLVAVFGGTLATVTIAIAIPEIPRVARIVRSAVLTIREEAYVEAAISLNTPTWKILLRHILPNSIAPLIIQATYVCAGAILVEAILSFLGVGLPADIPTWGNVMASGRNQFNEYPHVVLLPGIFLALTVLSVNILGDGLRDTLDPKFNKRGE